MHASGLSSTALPMWLHFARAARHPEPSEICICRVRLCPMAGAHHFRFQVITKHKGPSKGHTPAAQISARQSASADESPPTLSALAVKSLICELTDLVTEPVLLHRRYTSHRAPEALLSTSRLPCFSTFKSIGYALLGATRQPVLVSPRRRIRVSGAAHCKARNAHSTGRTPLPRQPIRHSVQYRQPST